MARGKRGGKRTPRQPAAVSGPGALSRRTDGGPAKPPVVANRQGYGVRQETEALAQAQPMYDEGASTPQGPTQPTPLSPGPLPDAFGPSQRGGAAPMPPSAPPAQDVLRAIYEAYPSPWIASLLHDNG